MRISLSASAEGKTLVPYPVTVLEGPYAISFFSESKGLISRVEVSAKLPEPVEGLPTVTRHSSGPIKATVDAQASDAELDLLSLLQYLESLGGLWLGLRKVHWEEVTRRWLPETPHERSMLELYSSTATQRVQETPQLLDLAVVRSLVSKRAANQWLVIPMAFLRQGIKDLNEDRSTSAFYNFYFFLEDLYAGGKWRSKAAKERFRASVHLSEVSRRAVAFLNSPGQEQNRVGIEQCLTETGLQLRAPDLLDLIVDMRGRLHHFSQQSSQVHAHPLNDRRFRPLAVLSMFVCLNAYPLIERDGKAA